MSSTTLSETLPTVKTRPRIIDIAIKVVLIGIFSWLIYHQVFQKENLNELKAAFWMRLESSNPWWLIITVILMPINWLFETLKWRTLEERVEHLSFAQSCKAVLAGVTFSIFTPNRIGEYGGRILFVKPENQMKTIVATLVGSYSQLLILLSLGYLGMTYMATTYWKLEPYVFQGIIFASLFLIVLLIYGYFNIDIIAKTIRRLGWAYRFKKLVKPVRILRSYSTQDMLTALTYAFLRYVTYAVQYYLLLRFFGVEISLFNGLASIATVFLIQTSIPLDPVTGLLARGKVALDIWGLFGANEVSILATTFGLWIINLLIPALVGIVFIINLNILKSLGYEKND